MGNDMEHSGTELEQLHPLCLARGASYCPPTLQIDVQGLILFSAVKRVSYTCLKVLLYTVLLPLLTRTCRRRVIVIGLFVYLCVCVCYC